jgi:uncharacterized protein (TIGR03000 family)
MYTLVLAAALGTGGVAPQYPAGHGYCPPVCYGCYGNYGCWGWSGCFGGFGTYSSCAGCFGYGPDCYGCHGGCFGGVLVAPVVPEEKPKEPEKRIEEDKAKEPGKGVEKDKPMEPDTAGEASPAVLTVEVPAGASLYINGRLMRTSSARRTFDTPPLEPGRAYSYLLRAEVVRGGRRVSETRRVEVRAGAVTSASFLVPERGVAAARR